MVRITKRGITKEIEEKVMNFFLRKIKNVKKIEDLNKIFSQILTKEEQIMVKKRLAIILFLREGKRCKDIQEGIDVSRTTISFIRKGLLKSPKKERKIEGKITKRDLKEIKKPPWYPAYKGKGRWQFLNSL
ncbi:hypothetical protein GW888_01940 [Candidatus Wolfebacteria bacterium]|nr:hypothetical protein [Candidatus Wolfebacteria bacterium]